MYFEVRDGYIFGIRLKVIRLKYVEVSGQKRLGYSI